MMNSDHGTSSRHEHDSDHAETSGGTTRLPVGDHQPETADGEAVATEPSRAVETTRAVDPSSEGHIRRRAGTAAATTRTEPAARTAPGDAESTTAEPRHRPVKLGYTRTAGTWAAVVVAIVVLVVLLIFILQNGQQAMVSFLGGHVSLPLGVALLMAAAIGGLLVALIGAARILQLRRTARRGS